MKFYVSETIFGYGLSKNFGSLSGIIYLFWYRAMLDRCLQVYQKKLQVLFSRIAEFFTFQHPDLAKHFGRFKFT
jgi:hypothetical protein